MLTTIETLFDRIRKIAKQKRKTNPSFDGKKFWQPIKTILSESSWKATKWRKQSKTKYDKIMSMPEFLINGHGNTEIIEKNHFLIQTVRIPKNEKPSLRKVCQIALNIGQYQGYTRKTIKNSSIKNYLLNSDCCILLKNILTNKKILELEQLLQK
jgi:hypothetical protein